MKTLYTLLCAPTTGPYKTLKHLAMVLALTLTAALPGKLFGQAPTISNGGPQTYLTGSAITPLRPAGSGVNAPAYSSSPVLVNGGFSNPAGIAFDAAGNMYVPDGQNIYKIAPGGSPAVYSFVSGTAAGIGTDAAGNVYAYDSLDGNVSMISPRGTITEFFVGLTGLWQIAVDRAGNIYFNDPANGAVDELLPGGDQIAIATGLTNPTAIALDAAGNVYVTDTDQGGAIKKIPAGGGIPVVIASGLGFGVVNLAVDAEGNLFASNIGDGVIKEFPVGGGAPVCIGGSFRFPYGLAVDKAFNVYVTEDPLDNAMNAGTIKKINPVGGYYINPALPAGLNFDGATGTISGTPTAVSPATNYNIYAYNDAGGNMTTVNIAVAADVRLTNLIMSSGTLNPVFAAGTNSYTDTVGNVTNSVTITPVLSDANATVKVNNTTVASGAASSGLPLNVGNNSITAVVTGRDGVSTNTYAITINRLPSTDASLSNITLSNGTLSPDFAAGTNSYTASVANTVTSITLTPTTTEPNATVTVNNVPVTTGSASAGLPLIVGDNIITMAVTAQDGTTRATYTVTINRAVSSDASLANLTLSDGSLNPSFAAGTNSYTATVANSITSVTLTPTANEPNAIISVNNKAVASGSASDSQPLVVGDNIITASVTAQDGTTKELYTITVTRSKSSDATLSNLIISNVVLDKPFDPDAPLYFTTVTNTITSVNVTPFTHDPNATVTIGNKVVATGTASDEQPLAVGVNFITIIVTAQDGTQFNYSIVATRLQSSDARLSNLELSSGTLSPVFMPGTNNYTAIVDNTVTSITVASITNEPNATITVNNAVVAPGSASASLPLALGDNTITTVVTSQDGSSTATYTITVTRLLSADATLANLTLSNGTLSPAFTPGTNSYTASVDNAVTSVTVNPTAGESNATVTVNNAAILSGSASASLPLNVGDNTITTAVNAQNGTTTATYTIIVNRAPSSDANLASLTLSSGILNPGFAAGTNSYTAAVPNAVSSITVTPAIDEPNARVMVNNSIVASGAASVSIPLSVGDNTITTKVTAQDGTTKNTYTIIVTRAPSADAGLADLAISSGTLTPSFLTGTNSYSAVVGNAVPSITVMPTVTDPNAAVTVNNKAVASGSASQALPLAAGDNIITTVVTAQDGTTKNTYTITVTRAPATNANLANLTISNGILSPVFAAGTNNYTASVGNPTSSIMVTPTVDDANATVVVNNQTVTSGSASASLPLNAGDNTITTTVTAQDGITKSTYTIVITRAPSAIANLSALNLNTGPLTPLFATATRSYSTAVGNSAASVIVQPISTDAGATITVNGHSVASGSTIANPLNVGRNVITVLVTAQDGTTQKSYTITVTRAISNDATLANLSLSSGSLGAAFASGTTSYTTAVSNTVTSVTVTPVTNNAGAVVTVNGRRVISGAASLNIRLNSGVNTITTVVTAQDGSTKNTYTLTINRLNPGPVFSYPGPQVYAVNNAIAPLAPLSNGVNALEYGNPATVSGINLAENVVTNAAGNVYVADGSVIKEFPAGGGSPISYNTGLSFLIALAVDAAGNMYTTDFFNNTVVKIPAGGGSQITLASGFTFPFSLAVDAGGNVYVGDLNDGTLSKIPAGGGSPSILGYDFGPITSLTVDAAGNLFASDQGNSTIWKIPSGSDTPVNFSTGVGAPGGLTTDPAGNLYIVDQGNSAIQVVNAGGKPLASIGGFAAVSNVAIDASGNLYATNFATGALYKATPVGGYFLSTPLPAGLNLDNATGVISGSPATISPATDYKVIAYNGNDGTTAAVNIKVTANADLTSLVLSSGTLSPAFAAGTNNYTDNVPNTVSSITVTPTVSDPAAIVKVNGTLVTSGSASVAIPLSTGANTITTVVTSRDGTTTNTYQVTVNVLPLSADATLAGLKPGNGGLSPVFKPGNTNYKVTVGNISAIAITPTASDPEASVTVNGIPVSSGVASAGIPINAGLNTITIIVTAANKTTTQTYTLAVTRMPSANANLAGLRLSKGSLSPVFNVAESSYTASVAHSITSITVTAKTVQTSSTITINNIPVMSGVASGAIPLNVGDNTITTMVKAPDGATTKTYTVIVTREANANANIIAVKLSNGKLSPSFAQAISSYTASVANTVNAITVTPTTSDPGATVTVNGTPVISGTASGPVLLNEGDNTITVTGTAPDRTTTKIYTLIVTRALAPLNSTYEPLSVNQPENSIRMAIGSDGILVHPGVSPNGDGLNDFLIIDGISAFPDNKLQIMSRNGELVFETSGYDNSTRVFDGHSSKNGKMQQAGTYFYSLDYKVNGVSRHKTGFIVLKY